MSPRSKKQYEEIREERRNLIMDTALKHFAREGYHATTINQIAQYAGISKGLMYNYFNSKEALLQAIIEKSVMEIYKDFDINRDGYLSEEEFEYFIRRMSVILKEKKSFWRLFVQILMQSDVRKQFLDSFLGSDSLIKSGIEPREDLFASRIMKMITDYFVRKKDKKGKGYDPILEINLFLITIKGFAITAIYTEDTDEKDYENTVSKIIELYK
jgi:AcrR family transcriptional regulator